jgi:hypothetical protein
MNDQADRKLTYADPNAGDNGLTEADAARFLLYLWNHSPGRLDHRQAVERFLEEFGGRFVTPGREGFQIDQAVRQRFERLAGREVVRDAQDRAWRWRYSWER